MPTIELRCPSCAEVLELDAGFAGGVCRCSNCGTLMTVPTTVEEAAERLQRPERPGAPSRPASPLASEPIEAESRAAGATDAEAAGTRGPESVGVRAGEESAGQVLTTDSGRTVRVDRDTPIPTARRKRPVVRGLTAGIVILGLVAMTGVILYALFSAIAPEPPDDPARAAVEQFGHDPAVNVFEITTPNVLGLALQSPCVVVVDASGAGRRWLTLVQDAIRAGLGEHDSPVQLALVYATEREPRVLRDAPEPLSELSAEQLHDFHETITAAGVASLEPALTLALSWQPRQLILITGREPDEVVSASMAASLLAQPDMALDLVLVDVDMRSDAADALSQRFGGRVLQLSEGQLMRWYREAEPWVP